MRGGLGLTALGVAAVCGFVFGLSAGLPLNQMRAGPDIAAWGEGGACTRASYCWNQALLR